MAVRYVGFDGEQVSFEWWVFLTAARRAGVSFSIREGHRTFARQAYFWSGSPTNPRRTWYGNLAAPPNNNAPHIRTGRFDHALDAGGAQGLINFGARNGVTIRRTVRGEEWHIEANAAQLAAFARRHARGAAFPTLRKGHKGPSVTRLQRMLRSLNVKGAPKPSGFFGLHTKRAVHRFQKKHGLRADGVVGPKTWRALRRAGRKR